MRWVCLVLKFGEHILDRVPDGFALSDKMTRKMRIKNSRWKKNLSNKNALRPNKKQKHLKIFWGGGH